MNQSDPRKKTVVIYWILLLLVPIIGLFQGEFKSYIVPVAISFSVLALFETILHFINKRCLRVIHNILSLSKENEDAMLMGDRKPMSYYISLKDPLAIELFNQVTQTKNTQLLFQPKFFAKYFLVRTILNLITFILLFVIIFTANKSFVWVYYLIWSIPTLLIINQLLNKTKLFNLFIKQIKYALNNKLGEVVHLAKKVDRMTKRSYGGESADYALSQYNLGGIYTLQNDHRLAEQSFKRALGIWSKYDNIPGFYYVQCLFELAKSYFANSKFRAAENHFLELLNIIKGDDRFSIEVLKKLSLLKLIQEDIPSVREYNNQIEERIIKCFGQESDEYVHFQYYKNFLELKEGNVESAENFYDADLEKSIRAKLKGEQLAKFLQNQGVYYMRVNNYEKAEEYFNEARDIRIEYWGEDHPAITEVDMNIAFLMGIRGEFDEQEKLIRNSLKINQNSYGEFSTEAAGNLAELGHCLIEKGDFAEAERCINKTLEIYEKLFSQSHPLYLNTMFNLGWLYDEKGEIEKAEAIIKDVFIKTKNILGDEHPILRNDRYQIASFNVRKGSYKEALKFYKQTKEIDDKLIKESFFLGGDQQKLKFLDRVFIDIDKIFSVITQYLINDPDAVIFGMNLILQRKALVGDILVGQNKFQKLDTPSELDSSFKELTELKRKLIHLQLEGFESLPVADYQQALNEYNKRKIELEEIISKKTSSDDLYNNIFNEDLRGHISSKLESNDVLIEFLKFKRFNFEDNKYGASEYLAFLQFSGNIDNIKCFSLGSADTIDNLIKDILSIIQSKNDLYAALDKDLTKSLNRLSSILLKPIINSIDNCNRLYLVPDGELHRLPFEALLLDGGKFVVERYKILYLNSGRDLVPMESHQDEGGYKESAIIANPDFDLGEKLDTATKGRKPERIGGLKHAKDLKWTQQEAEDVGKILKVSPITHQDANRKRVLELSSPEYLHFATHGFFMPKETELKNIEVALVDSESYHQQQLSTIQNPMLRSGLVLAGFNAWLSFKEVPKEMGNGLLTAMDIALMDLSHTKIVVLSACETALGDIDNGEGVFGLRRAFKLAGANRLVMSLWEVSDEETQQMMVSFYNNLNDDKNCFYEAFRDMQLIFINETSRNPYFWASFIFQGVDE
ncbi:CHAT domain-containing protein [Maribellus mangrovi]|uniref:CHAT domain-containing protein n=1 Tax=Maribellus mangrovi TaxID=3133146 RepID=UPI0030EE066C